MVRPRTPAGRAREADDRLGRLFPGTAAELCALDHGDAFQLLAATILSAQCTDERVNLTTPALFARFPDADSLADAPVDEVEALIRPTGFFRAKTAQPGRHGPAVRDRFDGDVPTRMADLVTLPGVGRKTANVVRSVAFGLPGLPVDTHVQRLSLRLGLTDRDRPGEGRARAERHGAGRPRGASSASGSSCTGGPRAGRGRPVARRACWPTSARRRRSGARRRGTAVGRRRRVAGGRRRRAADGPR